MNRQKRFLMLLLALLALAGGYSYWALPTQQRIANRNGGSEPSSAPKPATNAGGGLRLEQLQQSVPQFVGVRRDIFHFKLAPPPPPPPPPKIEQPLPPPPPPPVVTPPPVAAPSVVAARFEYLGRLRKGGKDLLFLASGKDIYLVAPGDKFGDQQQFWLKSADDDEVIIDQQGLNQPILLNLAEQSASGGSPPARPAALGRPLSSPAAGLVPSPPALQSTPPGSAPPTRGFQNFRRYRP